MIEYHTTDQIDPSRLNELWNAIGWNSRRPDRWKRALASSSLVVSAWDKDRLVGLGRVLEDGIMSMIYDVGVMPEYQGAGIGKAIMSKLIDFVKDGEYVSIGLFAWQENPDNIPFYESLGFEKVGGGMELEKYMKTE